MIYLSRKLLVLIPLFRSFIFTDDAGNEVVRDNFKVLIPLFRSFIFTASAGLDEIVKAEEEF